MRLRRDLALLPLDGEAVAFSEAAQCLLGLNAAAAMVARELQQGTRVADLALSLARQGLAPAAEAEEWVRATLDAFGSHGMLEDGAREVSRPRSDGTATDEDAEQASREVADMPPYTPFAPAVERRYRLLETCALIRFGSRAQLRWVDSVIGHLAAEDGAAPTIVIDLNATPQEDGELRSDIYRDGIPLGCAPRLSRLAPLVKAGLWQAAINAHDFLFYIHAGVVGTKANCILFPAAAGSGKSSLTAALVHRGFRYFSDEVALIQPRSFHVAPMPLAMGIKSTGWDVIGRYYPRLMSLPVHIRNDAKALRYLPPPAAAMQQMPLPVGYIIFPQYAADAPTELRPVARSEALGRLMGECLALRQRLDQRNVGELVAWIAGIECFTLGFSSLEGAVSEVVGVAW